MHLIKKTISIAASALLLSAAAAQAEAYLCDFKDHGRNNVIPQQVYVDVQTSDSAIVVDPFLIFMKQSPKKADFVRNTTKILQVRWTVDRLEFSGGERLDLKVSLVHRKARNKAFVTIQVVGADNTDQGTGVCTLQT